MVREDDGGRNDDERDSGLQADIRENETNARGGREVEEGRRRGEPTRKTREKNKREGATGEEGEEGVDDVGTEGKGGEGRGAEACFLSGDKNVNLKIRR